MSQIQDVLNMFSAEGVFAKKLQGYKVREEQQLMAEKIAQTILNKKSAVIEAGTGTGKTFAYLVPALMLGEKVVISTGTRNLQNQLFHKDLPLVRELLERPVIAALLKGRSNYLCSYRLEQHRYIQSMLTSTQARQLSTIEVWAQSTETGDISELSELPDNDSIWGFATSSIDNCLGQDCPMIEECHLNKARQAALKADVVVINHHLFFADAVMKEEGFGELLPSADVIVLDEAHQLHEVASRFFGMTFSSRKLTRLLTDLETEIEKDASDMTELLQAISTIDSLVNKMQRAFTVINAPDKGAWSELAGCSALNEVLQEMRGQFKALEAQLSVAEVRGRGLQNCQRRLSELMAVFRVISDHVDVVNTPHESDEPDKSRHNQATGMSEYVHWYERYRSSFSIHLTPLSVEEAFSLYRNQFKASWIYTSATLSVNNRFENFVTPLGLQAAEQLQLSSPFDFTSQACLYIPPDLPPPRDGQFVEAVIAAAIPILKKTQGRAFILFTSHAALQEAARLISGQIEFPLLVQGELGKAEILRRFRTLGNAVLLGTGDFWEGIDVRGAALSCVIIDKLPFASPSEPVVKAKIEHIKAQGRNPFMEFQVPSAVIGLKQGVGRLIRDINDRGLLVLCDNRLVNTRYGSVFLNSLPPMPLTRDWHSAEEFIENNLFVETDSDTEIVCES